MKRIIDILIFAAVLAGAASCALSKEEWVDFTVDAADLDPTKCFIPYESSASVMNEETLASSPMPTGTTFGEVMATEGAEDTKTTGFAATQMAKNVLSAIYNRKIRSYCGTYRSFDEDGMPITLSGRIIIPADGKVSRIMLVSHFTIGQDAEAPSRILPMEAIYAAYGIAVIEPDYIGYGVTADRVHPYLCADVTATNVVDMYFAGREYLKAIGCAPQYDDIFLLGYSQGGAVTMSVAQKLDFEYPEVTVRLTMCGSGPYDICATYDTLVDNDYTDYPCAIPMIIQGMNIGQHLNLDMKKYFLPNMLENMDEWLNSKKYTMQEITKLMGSKNLSSIMTKEARDKSKDIMTDLYRAMVDNSAINEWIPTSPLYLFHSTDDNVVPFVNTYRVINKYENYGYNIMYNYGHYGNHVAGALRFYASCITLMRDHNDI